MCRASPTKPTAQKTSRRSLSAGWTAGQSRPGKATLIEMKGPEVDRFLLWVNDGEPLGKLSRGQVKTWEGAQQAFAPDGSLHGELYVWAQSRRNPLPLRGGSHI
jgi:hypothetical protein